MGTHAQNITLVGGGHTHVQVLRDFAADSPTDMVLTMVVDTPIAVYSGMVPGFVAGQYRARELEIDVAALARQAGAHVIIARAVAIDTGRRVIDVAGQPPVSYDLASFDIGAAVAGGDLPGVREHALPTRPIGEFVRRVDEILKRARAQTSPETFRVVVVGGGAGGVELAFTIEQRLKHETEKQARVVLLEGGPRILAGYASSLARRVTRRGESRGIAIRCDEQVVAVHGDAVELTDGMSVPFDALLWATGARSQPLFRDSGVATDDRGFARIRSTLQLEEHDNLFAVGDCATLVDHADTPKAGVYAVRQGPVLTANLRATLQGARLRSYEPQRHFLTLLNLGDGAAVGTKWGLSFEGRWVMKLKDRIDRRFVGRFPSPQGRPR